MRKNWMAWLGFIIAPILCTGCQIMPEEEELKTAPVIRSYEVEEYEQSTVMRGDLILSMTVDCVYVAAKQEALSFSLGGEYIDKLYVSEGQEVRAGELLAELKYDNLKAQISEQEYALEIRKVQKSNILENRNLDLSRQDTVLSGLDAQMESLMAQIESYDEQISLYRASKRGGEPGNMSSRSVSIGGEPDDMSDESEEVTDIEQQKAALTEQVSAIIAQKQEQQKQRESVVKSYEKQLQEVEDSLYIGQLRLEELKDDLKQRQIYAGIDGTVTYVREIDEGDRSVLGERFITIADMDTNVFTVSGEDAQYFTVGMQVSILCGKTEYTAEVVEASAFGLAKPQQGDEPVAYLRLSQPDPTLEDGKRGRIELTLDQRKDVLYVDKSAIKTANGEQLVYMLDENGLRTMQKVVTGLTNNDYAEIISGLKEGDRVIIE